VSDDLTRCETNQHRASLLLHETPLRRTSGPHEMAPFLLALLLLLAFSHPLPQLEARAQRPMPSRAGHGERSEVVLCWPFCP
jgi:hypothetical protein